MNYIRPSIEKMTGYVPGEQPQSGTKIIKLNTNENPYPPSPKVMAALAKFNHDDLRCYPDPFSKDFCRSVSKALNVSKDWVIVGNGSDDLLNILTRACADDLGRKVVYPVPTYVLYSTLSAIQDAEIIEIPYSTSFELPIAELIAANGAITFIASPNSPSGHVVPLEDLRKLAKGISGLLVIDEAYVDFAEFSALSLVAEFENVVVLRTLSKGYSLAGLRMGFGVAQPTLLSQLFKVKDVYNIDAVAITLGTVAMNDQDYKNECVAKVKLSRIKLMLSLRKLGFTIPDSHGNFLLATPPLGNAHFLQSELKQSGILVRYFNQRTLEDKLRITVGTDEQNEVLIKTLATLVKS
jgi:histidinol-phosphate aminotransferase